MGVAVSIRQYFFLQAVHETVPPHSSAVFQFVCFIDYDYIVGNGCDNGSVRLSFGRIE